MIELSATGISEARTKAIPILAEPRGATVGGTGFLARVLGRPYLLTAGHIGQHELAVTSDWSTWAPSLAALLPDGTRLELPLFAEDPSGRTPLFHFHETGPEPGRLLDAMALGAGHYGADLARLEHAYGAFDLPAAMTSPGVGQRLFVFGFPTAGDAPWPQHPTPILARTTLGTRYGYLFTEPGAGTGYSGGPVVYPDGALAGLYFGEEAASGNGAAVAAEAVPLLVSESPS
ncbi:trypsin-like peptidase domain-containing protein [Agrococcus citreus]|uniref:Trypsin-like peptidase domain-containing protein n=1 Tax=Agrococcus citreus TaxID=84643 RepID=A0ABP4JIQ2_9MICO